MSKHNISITTVEALLINKALGFDMQNDVDNLMAKELSKRINEKVAYDLKDYRCEDCVYFNRFSEKRNKGQCAKRSGWSYNDIRSGKAKACKTYFIEKEKKNE